MKKVKIPIGATEMAVSKLNEPDENGNTHVVIFSVEMIADVKENFTLEDDISPF